jgi:hypothetical protein
MNLSSSEFHVITKYVGVSAAIAALMPIILWIFSKLAGGAGGSVQNPVSDRWAMTATKIAKLPPVDPAWRLDQ